MNKESCEEQLSQAKLRATRFERDLTEDDILQTTEVKQLEIEKEALESKPNVRPTPKM